MDKAGLSGVPRLSGRYLKVTGLPPLQYRNGYSREFAE